MTAAAINGVIVTPLRIIADDRGAVMHMLRADAAHFRSFGEIYFSVVNPGAVKAWKRHHEMTLNLAVVAGRLRLVLFDDRDDSATSGRIQEIIMGPDDPGDYKLVTVPPLVWSGFSCAGDSPATMANCASILHRPDEADGLPADTDRIPYRWL